MSGVVPRINGIGDRRLTAHEYVRETLRGAILRGELQGGARLIQAEVAAQLDVSTTPVREALRDLAADGFITLDRHRGGVVRQFDWNDMQEILSIRQALEPLAVRLAIEHITDEELRQAEQLVADMQRADVSRWVEFNRAFHCIFHDATRAPRLAGIMKGLQEASGIFVAQAERSNPQTRRRALSDHRALVEAFRKRDAERALAVQLGHIGLPIAMTKERRAEAGRSRSSRSKAGSGNG